MSRTFVVICALTLLAVLGSEAWAQAWPTFPLRGHAIDRGPGGYLSWLKLLLAWLLFLTWVKTTDWINMDCQKLNLPYSVWTASAFFPFLVGMVLLLMVPLFLAAYPLALLCWAVPLVIYIVNRNGAVEPHERVLTPAHIRFLLAQAGNKAGLKISAEKRALHEMGAQVDLRARGGANEQANQANMVTARQSVGYVPTKDLVAMTVDRRAERAMLDVNQQQMNVKFLIDGVWLDGEPQERETADPMVAVIKLLCNLKPAERRARQAGKFEATYNDSDHELAVTSQGTKTGERVLLQVINNEVPFKKFEELGARDKVAEGIRELLKLDKGLILFSSLPSGGLTSTVTVALRESDRYMNDVLGVRRADSPEPVVENVEIFTYAPAESPSKQLPSLLRKQPNVVVAYEVPDLETCKMLGAAASEDKLIYATVRAKEAIEAPLRLLMLKIPPPDLIPAIVGVVNQRLIRKLCESCKEAYTPSPELLKKLGIPAGRVQSFYRPPENPEEVCEKCEGIGYFERTSIFELLNMDEDMRQAFMRKPNLEALRQLARKKGHRSLQEEGLVMVARGITSLSELQRVLKA